MMTNHANRLSKLEKRFGLDDGKPLFISWTGPLVSPPGPEQDQLLRILEEEGLLPKSGFVCLMPSAIPAGSDEEVRKFLRETPASAFSGGLNAPKTPANAPVKVRITGRASCYCSDETEESE